MACIHFVSQNWADSLQGKFIYKDECIKCFSSCRDPEGIDVCLKCFLGSCAQEHSFEHCQELSHPLAVNFRQIYRKSSEESIAELMISEADEFEAITIFKCVQCNLVLEPNQAIISLIDSVLLNSSASFQNSVDQWEIGLKPCEHVLTLQQTGSAVAENLLAKCGLCDLISNLWMCMTCGNLGCGRTNFINIGGNGHALFHYQSSLHPLVCKMGTITPVGTASIYCYVCENEILDPDLHSHLLLLGIEVQKQEKTEKTPMEIDLEANINIKF